MLSFAVAPVCSPKHPGSGFYSSLLQYISCHGTTIYAKRLFQHGRVRMSCDPDSYTHAPPRLVNDDGLERTDLPMVPEAVQEVIWQVKEACGLIGGVGLQYKDDDFGGVVVTLSSTSMIEDLNTIKDIRSLPDNDIIPEFLEYCLIILLLTEIQ